MKLFLLLIALLSVSVTVYGQDSHWRQLIQRAEGYLNGCNNFTRADSIVQRYLGRRSSPGEPIEWMGVPDIGTYRSCVIRLLGKIEVCRARAEEERRRIEEYQTRAEAARLRGAAEEERVAVARLRAKKEELVEENEAIRGELAKAEEQLAKTEAARIEAEERFAEAEERLAEAEAARIKAEESAQDHEPPTSNNFARSLVPGLIQRDQGRKGVGNTLLALTIVSGAFASGSGLAILCYHSRYHSAESCDDRQRFASIHDIAVCVFHISLLCLAAVYVWHLVDNIVPRNGRRQDRDKSYLRLIPHTNGITLTLNF